MKAVWSLCCALVLGGHAVLGAQVVVEVGSVEYPPYTSEEGGGTGLVYDIMAEALGPGFIIKPMVLPPARVRALFQEGKITVMTFDGGTKDNDRIDQHPYLHSRQNFYVRKDSPELAWNTLSDLKGKTLGILMVSRFADQFSEAGILLQPVNSLDQAFKMLQAGRVDFVISDELTAAFVIRKLYPEGSPFKTATKPFVVFPGALWFNLALPAGEQAHARFEKGIRELIRSGRGQVILEKYFGKGHVPRDFFIPQD